MTARRELGQFGERVARHRLEAAGMRVVETNVRVASGEIDLVARDPGGELVFVEVRTRRGAPGAAAESLAPAKLQRMWRCAMEYCERDSADPERARLDLVTIELDASGRAVSVDHLVGLEIPG